MPASIDSEFFRSGKVDQWLEACKVVTNQKTIVVQSVDEKTAYIQRAMELDQYVASFRTIGNDEMADKLTKIATYQRNFANSFNP